MERKPRRTPEVQRASARTASAANQGYTSRTRTAQTGRTARSSYTTQSPRTTYSTYGTQTARTAQPRQSGRAPERPMPRRRKRDPIAVLAPILMLLALLAGIVYVGSCWFISTINQSTYCSNIYVNGVDISRYSKEEGMQVVRDLIDQRLNTSHTLGWNDSNWSFTASDFGGEIEIDSIMERAWNIGHVGNIFDRSASIRSLKRNPIYLTATLSYSEDLIDTYVDEMYNQLYVAPTDATVAADLDTPYLASKSSKGQELDKDTARAQIISLIETGDGGSVLPVLTLEPAFSTEQAMNSLELIVEYKTDTTARGYNGRFNVRKALQYFYGMIIQPGEEVSFNEVVGPRTGERGWQLGTEYIGGGKTQEGYGGGVCQASTTLYGAILKAGMTILERSPHSMTVAYMDPSLDAAVADDSKDLRFRNDTDNPITIYTEVTKDYAMVQIYGVRPAYRYELMSVMVHEESTAVRTAYIDDVDGTYCTYTDETKLYKEGRAACSSEGWRIAYDWTTGEEVERTKLSYDMYSSGTDIYWRGIQARDGSGIDMLNPDA